MPPKRSAPAYKPTRVEVEDVSLPTPKAGSTKRTLGTKLESDIDYDKPGRPSLKRQRVDLTKPASSDEESHQTSEDESNLKSSKLTESDNETLISGSIKSSSKLVRSPAAALSKSPLKQLKLEDMSPTFKSKAHAPTGLSNVSPRKKKLIATKLGKPHPAPASWERQYKLIEEMRANIQAPVDTMGCCSYMSGEGDPKDQRFGALVSLILSAQTRDEITSGAVANLRRVLPGGLTISSILSVDPSVISGAIKRVSYHERKTEYLRATAATLRDKFDGDVPKTVDELCSLQGVGPKIAMLTLQVAWDINIGIGVDVHVHRITNRLGWHDPPTTTPEKTRMNLESWLPRELHKPINPLLVGFGQVICLPVGPRCDSCMLATEGLCPSARADMSAKGRKPIIHAKREKTETLVEPNLDIVGLVRAEGVKAEKEVTMDCDVGGPRVEIKLE